MPDQAAGDVDLLGVDVDAVRDVGEGGEGGDKGGGERGEGVFEPGRVVCGEVYQRG